MDDETKRMYRKVADWLDKLPSHGVIDVDEAMADLLSEIGAGITWKPDDASIGMPGNPMRRQLTVRTVAETRQQMEARGLGGNLGPNATNRCVNVWELSEQICRLLLERDPGAFVYGRGAKHSLCVDALRRAADGA